MTDLKSVRIEGETELEKLVQRSRLLGADPELVVHGGGNTSSKILERDHLGRERWVLRVKGSGTDLKTIGPDGFPGVYLDEILPLRERAAMTDEEMSAYLTHCMVEPGARRPSIETLLHGFLPARHVDHTHADAICILSNNPRGEDVIREALGEDVAYVPYIRPGFELSRQVGAQGDKRAAVLAYHGLVTWGDSHEESLTTTLELVDRAKRYVATHSGSAPMRTLESIEGEALSDLLLRLRGRLSRRLVQVLWIDRSQRALADRPDVEIVAASARATPDHVLRIGPWTAVIRHAGEVDAVIDAYEQQYLAYFERNRKRLPDGLTMLSATPRVMLVPGLGCITVGPDARTARVAAEVAYRSHHVTAQVLDTFGEVRWLNEGEIFDIDYWPLELAKLKAAPAPPPLGGHIILVGGVTDQRAQGVVSHLAALGAHLVLAGADERASAAAASIPADKRAIVQASLDDERQIRTAVDAAVDTFGGLDAVVVMGHADVPALTGAMRQVFDRQDIEGSLVLVGRADSKAPERCHGVRANAVHTAHDASINEVAAAVTYLISDEAAHVSGCVIPVGA
jgi:rhamnose utilization protein RhaD (predicted bifunctional aldolase and dehydrogenase)